MDRGEDGDDDDGDSSRDDTDDEDEDGEDEDEEEDEEEEEHLALADSAVIVPTIELVSPPEGTEPASISLPPKAEVERLLAMPTPPPSPPISLSPPFVWEHLDRCMAPSSHSSPPPALVDTVTIALPSPPLPPSLYIPLLVDRRDDIPESEQSPRKRLCLFALGSSTLDVQERRRGIGEVGVIELVKLYEHDTQDLYALLEDAQDSRTRISQRVTMDSQRVDFLMGDRMTLHETVLIVEEEAYASQEAWAHLIGLSQAVHHELQTHCDHVYVHETQIQSHQTQLQLHGTLIQTKNQIVKALRVMRDIRREMGDMQAELLALREQRRRARQPAPYARVLDHQDASRDADSHIYWFMLFYFARPLFRHVKY
ncbi:hypothetical protein Tco_1269998 [Tanacetum coccineum]